MRFVWSIVLLAAVAFAVAGPLFLGHGLAAHESAWLGYAAVCVVVAAVLLFLQKRFRTE
jgi:hypothetical protein